MKKKDIRDRNYDEQKRRGNEGMHKDEQKEGEKKGLDRHKELKDINVKGLSCYLLKI